MPVYTVIDDKERSKSPRQGVFRRLRRSEDGVAAIEFALLAMPFFMILFAIVESCVAFAAEQVLENGVDTMGRKLRTGEASDLTADQFRAALCNEIDIMLSCDATALFIDVREFPNFANIPTAIPRVGGNPFGDLDPAGFAYDPGGPDSDNVFRAYYKWPIITDLVRPYITNIRPADGSMPSDYLIVETAAFSNEKYE